MSGHVQVPLRPCPFCGKAPNITQREGGYDGKSGWFDIQCKASNLFDSSDPDYKGHDAHVTADKLLNAINIWNQKGE